MQKKKILAFSLAVLCLLSAFTGCAKGNAPTATPSNAAPIPENASVHVAEAMGRYVERQLALPESGMAMDMVMLSDGRLRVAVQTERGEVSLSTLAADGSRWEESGELPEEIMVSGIPARVALSPDGTVFCYTLAEADEEGSYAYHFWVVDAAGACREIPICYPGLDLTAGYLLPSCDFTDSGILTAQFYYDAVMSVVLDSGELGPDLNELEADLFRTECAGEDMYMLGISSVSVHHQGQTQAVSGVLNEQLTASLLATERIAPHITFWENDEGYLFYTTHEGLYSYIPGGSVVEELVSGARSTLGDPSFMPEALAGTAEGDFYVLGNRSGEAVLCLYHYDAEMPTASHTRLRIFSLYENDDLRQMISRYQSTHGDVFIDLEIGVSGENGVTEADAIRSLNTAILAGDGPDILCLDGFSLDAYLEKGVLCDLRDVLARTPTLTQVTECYAAEGKVCALPACFALPVMYGPGHIVSQIQDLDSLVTAAEQARAENETAMSTLNAILPAMTADKFYDSCSAAWLKADGTLDETALTAYYAAMQSLYALDAPVRASLGEELGDMGYVPGEYTAMSGSMMICMDNQCLDAGTLEGMELWSFVLMGDEQLEDYETVPLHLQADGVFLPLLIMAVVNTGAQIEAAKDFVAYMLSDEVQSACLGSGFPVNRLTFERDIAEDKTVDSTFSTGDMSFSAKYPDAALRLELKSWVDALTAPALTDRTIRNMVMGQMDDCLNGRITPREAAAEALRALNLYLSE